MMPRLLRVVALLIVIAAIMDPGITTSRRVRPVVSVVGVDPARDSALIAQVTGVLDERYTIVHAPLASAAGTVVIGDRVSDAAMSSAAPAFTVTSVRNGPAVSLRRVEAPLHVMLDARVPVTVSLAVRGMTSASPRDLHIELLHGGIVQSSAHARASRDSALDARLTFIPASAGPAMLTIRAFVAGAPDTVRHGLLVDVRANRWSVLFFDRRPSWISTFVRRALERDPRFAVTSRIVTSTNVSRQTGSAPEALDAIAAAGAFDAVVIGSPEALTARDVNGVSTLLRSRGASVLVLPDHPANSSANALFGFGGWRMTPRRVAASVVSEMAGQTAASAVDAIRLKGLSIGTPARLPAASRVIAVVRDSTRTLPVIWQTPIGLGQLYVSGAFDAWRFRDTSQSTFDATWRDLVDEAASAHQPPLDLQVTPRLILPRGAFSVAVRPRDSLNVAPVVLSLRALRGIGDDATTTPITTTARRGGVESVVRAPLDTGVYEVLAVQGADSARTSIRVAAAIARDADNDAALLTAWTASRAGRVVSRDSIASLPNLLDSTLKPVSSLTEWHPMRSPWWIVPLALVLAAEWGIRRLRTAGTAGL